MPYIPPSVVQEVKRMDLFTYLKNYEPYELVHFSGNTYTTRTHDSLKISNGKWMWWSQRTGGRSALDYLIKVKGYNFLEAVELLAEKANIQPPISVSENVPMEKQLLLPKKNQDDQKVIAYLSGRGIDKEIIQFCLESGRVYESSFHHNAVFVGMDEKDNPKYAALRGIGTSFIGEANGSDKNYSFLIPAEKMSDKVHVFESAIDLLSYQYGIGEYVELIKAIMMQESGGRGLDPMQCSEGSFNTKYPRQPNGITDPEYSISCGVQEIKSCLERAGVKNPLDMENIKLALQSYNYGNGYLEWAKARGGYTLANAAEFSDMMAQRMGWSSYGDKQYVPHVLQYYAFGRIPTGIGNQAIVQVAASQEGKGGTTYWSWYGFGSRVEWCACFVSWCADQSGYIQSGVIPKFSLCSDGVKWFESKGRFRDASYTPAVGDIIFFDWGNNGTIDHVGIVESVSGGTVNTIEGNSGDKVARRSYSIGSSNIYGYGVPAY